MDANTIMPYGAHKGKLLKDVPASYFDWLAGQIKEKSKLHWTLTEKLLIKYYDNIQQYKEI